MLRNCALVLVSVIAVSAQNIEKIEDGQLVVIDNIEDGAVRPEEMHTDENSARIAVGGTLNVLTILSLYQNYLEVPFEINLKLKPVKTIGLDFMVGFLRITGNEGDSASKTYRSCEEFALSLNAGISPVLHKGDRAEMALVAYIGGVVYKAGDYITDTSVAWDNYYEDEVCLTKLRFVPTVFVGLEPTCYMSNNFAIFTRLGFALTYSPASVYIDDSDPEYLYHDAEDFWKKRKDGKFIYGFRGLNIGFRYYF